jgi:hypothetical protein
VISIRGVPRLPETLVLRICLKFTSYSTLKSKEKSGTGRRRMRDIRGERCSGLKPGPKAEEE